MYEIFKNEQGKFFFRLKDEKGNVLLLSDGYTQKTNCEKGVGSVKRNARDRDRFIYVSQSEGRGFAILSGNGRFPAQSPVFKNRSDLDKTLETTFKIAPIAEIKDLTKRK